MTTIARCAGVVLPIPSLPSRFGIGDLGPAARRFVDFLQAARQRLWQILPLNPIDARGDFSPYDSWSAFAGNTLLISPEDLVKDRFLADRDLNPLPRFDTKQVDYAAAVSFKESLFDIAFKRFQNTTTRGNREAFRRFRRANDGWLDDAARFKVLKDHLDGLPWQQWPATFKRPSPAALRQLDQQFGEALEKEKFLQFLFDRQLRALRRYCLSKGLQLFGDIPIYVNADSADVWGHPDIFQLDRDGRPVSVSGVPPDYFSVTGQLWGHPLFNWQRLQATGYEWWLQRIGHNLERFDWLRIDHFRGLVAFWEVPAHHTSAIDGQWTAAPVDDFLTCLLRRFPLPPIVAEDLGVITADVRETLRRYRIPGMRVALFAFGSDFPRNAYLPHAMDPHCAYFTGTHDTNTVRGWFRHEAKPAEKQRLQRYVGHTITEKSVHWDLIRLVMQSPARMALVPMQDLLGLGRSARTNRPGQARGNWRWRLDQRRLTPHLARRLATMTTTYGRD
ncbi:4-alpha-glucanotransferase [Desulfatitalea alkaliphila]|uniref:4-alpha-glucanotransferase n=1 Tax=Desulfatitalea alkaliphila TaxID=2929485 RepID=A0AA41R346_9BACT|nr:4-alpha-glucanotransferase [Desulfatitalea alkaliphila]MCJ8500553.1 4-alpha-glucanotransferase [Desulfatitalea alkaliphila]